MDLITEQEKALFAKLGIPVRFQNKGFSNYDANISESIKALRVCKDFAHNFAQNFELGAGLILAGAPGTGKTHLAFSILRYVVTKAGTKKLNTDPAFNAMASNNQSYSAIYTTVFDLLKRVKATWGNGSTESEKSAIAAYSTPDLLILDEVGMQHGTDTEKVILFEIIDCRYRDMKPTVIVGNLTISELTEYLGERVIDRMREGGGTAVIFGWESYRKRDQ